MMRCLLDTDTCIELIRHRHERVLLRLLAHVPGDVAVSAITAAELAYGMARSRDRARNAEALDDFLSPLVVAPFDHSAALTYGRIRASLEAAGQVTGDMDTLIGAHAVALGVVLVTHNTREFARIEGLALEDWLGDDGPRGRV